jgi:hypothetical protein
MVDNKEIDYLLSKRPSDFFRNKELLGRLKTVFKQLDIYHTIRWGGCTTCIAMAYKRLSTLYGKNFMSMENEKYIFRDDINKNGYRDSKSGLVLRNDSPLDLRKAVYNRSDSHKTLFKPFIEDPVKVEKEEDVKSPVKKRRSRRKKSA